MSEKPTARCEECGKEFTPGFFGRSAKVCADCRREESQGRQRILTMRDVEAAGRSEITVTAVIMGACAAVYIGMVLSGADPMGPSVKDLIPWGANYALGTLGGQPWRLLTYMFVHGGLIHIALNMWVLWSVGRFCEQLFGKGPFLLLYLMCGVGGGLASLWWHPNVVSVGASGAIFGAAGAMFSSLYLKNREVPTAFLRAHMSSIGSFIGYNLVFGLIIPQVDNSAHVGGLLTGALIGALLPRPSMALGTHRGARSYLAFVVVAAVLALGGFYLLRKDAAAVEFARGERLIEDKHYAEAIPHLERAAALEPAAADAQYALGFAYSEDKQYGRAQVALEKAAALDPDSAPIHAQLGFVYKNQSNLAAAEKELKRAAELAPANAEIQYYLAAFYLDQGRWDEAIPQMQKVLRLDPDYLEAQKGLAEAQAAKATLSSRPAPAAKTK